MLGLVLVASLVSAALGQSVETFKSTETTVNAEDDYSLTSYPASTWACTKELDALARDRLKNRDTTSVLFGKLFKYISGENINMTAPVLMKNNIKDKSLEMCFYLTSKGEEVLQETYPGVYIMDRPAFTVYTREFVFNNSPRKMLRIKDNFEAFLKEKFDGQFNSDYFYVAGFRSPQNTEKNNKKEEIWFEQI